MLHVQHVQFVGLGERVVTECSRCSLHVQLVGLVESVVTECSLSPSAINRLTLLQSETGLVSVLSKGLSSSDP